MRFIELFAGIGGFRYGLENCRDILQSKTTENIQDMPSTSERQTRFTCAWANEIDKYACQIYRKNYGEGELYEGDITKVNTEEIPDHDLLVGGFPCQAFSIAGKRGGFDDTRGTLFFEIARICRAKKPRLILLENVKGLLSHDSGKTFQTILKVLSDIGYILQWEVLNSKNFGVPQNRERVFIIGHSRGTPRAEVFPITGESENHGLRIKGRITGISGHDILKRCYGIEGVVPALNTCGGGNTESKIAIPVLTPDRPKKRQNGRRFKNDGEPSFTLTGQDKHGVSDGLKIRRLTPTECCRLQGFPDNWVDGISDSQKYKCLGNAVTTNVITEIGKRLMV